MTRLRLGCLIALALGLALFWLGAWQAKPGPVEQALLAQAGDLVADSGLLGARPRVVIEEISERAKKALLPRLAELDLDEAGLTRALTDASRLAGQSKKQRRAQAAADAPEPHPAAVIKAALEGNVAARGQGLRVLGLGAVVVALGVFGVNFLALARRTRERLIRGVFLLAAGASIVILLLILVFLVTQGLPVFKVVSVWDFVSGKDWYPTESSPALGILPLIAGSLAVTALSSLLAIPLGVMTAVYLAEIARPGVRAVVKPMIELLASLPSVVIGFFGMVVVAPFLQDAFHIPLGLNLFNASLMLAFMSVPTITSVSEDAIFAVPVELKEASLALGATRFETLARVVVPASLSGISTAVILGMSRAIGETMVVLMVAGGAGMIPTSIFDPVRPMPASIAAEMGEAPFGSDHSAALFAIGMVLFLFTMLFNLVADHIAHKYRQAGAATL
jgi:phosphate transport system permease protein